MTLLFSLARTCREKDNNGEQAIELINRTRFDQVITDLVMDRIDGIQVLKAAKTRVSETMVLILTGYGDMGSPSMPFAWMPTTTCSNRVNPTR